MAELANSSTGPDQSASGNVEPPPVPGIALSGEQRAAEAVPIELEVLPPLHGLTVAQVVEGLVVARPQSFGDEAIMRVISAVLNQHKRDFDESRHELRAKEESNHALSLELGTAKSEKAVLLERLGYQSKLQRVRGLSGLGGTVLIGFAIDFYKSQLQTAAIVVGLIGVVLVLFSLIGVPGKAES